MIPKDAFLILSVGEINSNKNQKVILDAMAALNDKDIYYVLCGRGRNGSILRALAIKYGIESNIRFVDYRKDVVNFYRQADAFALPSYREGLPIALLEAMYCEVPPITSNARGVCDVMEDKVTGIVCSPDDSRAFARAIRTLKKDSALRKKYGQNSRKAVEPYVLPLLKDKVLELFNSF